MRVPVCDAARDGDPRFESASGGTTRLMSTAVCTHLDRIAVTQLPVSMSGCEECLKLGSPWVHLRMCMSCGKIGCCDSSPNRHASRHALEDGHPIARSAQPGEDWSWCYVDEAAFVLEPDAGGGAEA